MSYYFRIRNIVKIVFSTRKINVILYRWRNVLKLWGLYFIKQNKLFLVSCVILKPKCLLSFFSEALWFCRYEQFKLCAFHFLQVRKFRNLATINFTKTSDWIFQRDFDVKEVFISALRRWRGFPFFQKFSRAHAYTHTHGHTHPRARPLSSSAYFCRKNRSCEEKKYHLNFTFY